MTFGVEWVWKIGVQPYDSSLWKALAGIWDDFHRHVFWKIRDGRSTDFLLDKWPPSNESLTSLSNQAYVDTALFC
jgi:hypothetical protein